MTSQNAAILHQLNRSLATDLAPEIRTMGLRLRDRLARPVRVVVTGSRGSGKSTLCALLQPCAAAADLALQEELLSSQPRGTLAWASDTDIMLWCAQEFGPEDRALWNQVPESLKDHSFLILTKADRLAAQGRLLPTLSAMQELDDAFRNVLPLATLLALASREQSDSILFRTTGGAEVEQELLHDARAGRRAVQDSALLFLRRYGGSQEQIATGLTAPQPTKTSPLTAIHAYLESTLPGLAPIIALTPYARATATLAHCAATADGLADLLSQTDLTVPAPLCEDIMTIADTIQLMQAEGKARAAADALGLLLQIRREVADYQFS